jgi:hypothetical protein
MSEAEQAEHTAADRLARESGLWRTLRVIGLVLAIGTLGGGWTASAA